ncbi:MAG TPA: acetyl-CoA carboxylase biotin carboxylase subunit [Lentisphaeria bacterium]|nr:acetyl-CoA carboxylase biotin carboxylase subunit [Lentisphaeria bacterium]
MFNKILIANRGEIALRIIRACKELNVRTVVVYSQADEDTLPVQLADEHVCIGPPASSDSYLRIDRIISAAEICDVDAIHPGYGFLAENARFAEICNSCQIKFIGPDAASIAAIGDKAIARSTMKAAGVPVTPGSDSIVEDEKAAVAIARDLGYPVIIKATAGGGGRGIRVAHNDASLVQSFHACRQEAENAFGNNGIYIEKFIEKMRHVEIQILADEHGNVVHLGERDCSIQRRRQKLIEESPSPALDDKLRKAMGKAAITAAVASNYKNAGTVEFILTADNQFYFMEMNTRIQVEHPVTEEVTGIDLIIEQIRIAAGEELGYSQNDIKMQGHAIEVRINAEAPDRNFAPCPGTVTFYHPPGGGGVRIDSHVYSGYTIPPHYDSMISKLIVHGRDRQECIKRCQRALSEYLIEGIDTTIPFALQILYKKDFINGVYDTDFVEQMLADGV